MEGRYGRSEEGEDVTFRRLAPHFIISYEVLTFRTAAELLLRVGTKP